jgi:hypothetical protein
MKKVIAILLGIFLGAVESTLAQGFVDLDFENATIVSDSSSSFYPYAVYASDALPGWTIAGGFLGAGDIFYNDQSLGAPSIALFGVDEPEAAVFPILDGTYSIDLYGGVYLYGGEVSISQTGSVPGNASSIQFIAEGDVAEGPLLVSLGGQNISFSAISTGPNYTTYGGNIPPGMAGQMELLEFAAPAVGGNNYWELDDIQFSPTSVPEPGVLTLMALGSALCGFRFLQKL